jgi:hypothetical protein
MCSEPDVQFRTLDHAYRHQDGISRRPVIIVSVTEETRTQGNHTRVQGYGLPSIPRRCAECGAALTLVYYADGGTLWTGCPNDPGLARG